MLWSPPTQATIAVLAIGGLLFLAHVVSVRVNAGVSAG